MDYMPNTILEKVSELKYLENYKINEVAMRFK